MSESFTKMASRSTSESEISAASQESGYNTMAAPDSQRVDSMPIPIPRTSSTGGNFTLFSSLAVADPFILCGA